MMVALLMHLHFLAISYCSVAVPSHIENNWVLWRVSIHHLVQDGE